MSRQMRFAYGVGAVALSTFFFMSSSPAAADLGSQAAQGGAVYAAQCSTCHGANLEGGAGPPLSGPTFKVFLNGTGTASHLFDFISEQMPLNAPASLSQPDYLGVTAFLLRQNGLAPTSAALTSGNLASILLKGGTPVVADAAPATANNEIVAVPPPARHVFAPLPSGADVSVSDDMMTGAAADSSDWLLNGRTYSNDRYSPLTQINATNVGSLSPVALVQTGMAASFETTPIVVKGVMYATTPVVNSKMMVMALNAATGERLWVTTISLGAFQICCGPVNRGVAVGYGKVFVMTLDDKLIALSATDGSEVWEKTVADPSLGYSETMAPQLYDGKVIVGSAGGEWALRGFVAAYAASDGAQKWRWWATDPKTFSGDSWKGGGGMVWTTPAIDPARKLLVFSTGNPNPDLDGSIRPGDNLWTDSIVGLDLGTGTLRWAYQEIKHDVWDYDAVAAPLLFNVTVDGKTVPAAGEAGKVGWVFIVNRDTGALIRKSDAYVMMTPNMFSAPTAEGVVMLPGANGGDEWSPPAYSPQTHMMYIPAMDQLMRFATHPTNVGPDAIRLGSAFSNVEPGGIQDGPLVAVNMETGKVAWQVMLPQPLIGGALATAGNLVFTGEGNGWFDAFDATTGKALWRYQLGAGVNAPPITYAVGGVQYVAVAAGGNFQLGYPYGDTIAIFKVK